jgi:hypothetical protein
MAVAHLSTWRRSQNSHAIVETMIRVQTGSITVEDGSMVAPVVAVQAGALLIGLSDTDACRASLGR